MYTTISMCNLFFLFVTEFPLSLSLSQLLENTEAQSCYQKLKKRTFHRDRIQETKIEKQQEASVCVRVEKERERDFQY